MEFFHLSKIIWFFLIPGNALAFLGVLGLVLTLSSRFRHFARGIVYTVIIIIGIITFIPVDVFFMHPLEKQYPVITYDKLPQKVDGVIVLGGSISPGLTRIYGQTQIIDNPERITTMLELMKKYPSAKVIFTGGSGDIINQSDREAIVIKDWLDKTGLEDSKRIIFESNSRNTYENAVLSKELVHPQEHETWLLVTSAYHMPRSKAIFDKAGWKTVPYPVDFHTDGQITKFISAIPNFTKNLLAIETAVHEYIGLAAYKISGKI